MAGKVRPRMAAEAVLRPVERRWGAQAVERPPLLRLSYNFRWIRSRRTDLMRFSTAPLSDHRRNFARF